MGCSSGNRPSSGQSFSGRTITSTELIESLTSFSPPLTIGFSRKTLCLYYRCTIPLPNVLLVRISNLIAFIIQSPSNQLNNGNCPSMDIHLWFYPNPTGIYHRYFKAKRNKNWISECHICCRTTHNTK